jgi:hypothetical protein
MAHATDAAMYKDVLRCGEGTPFQASALDRGRKLEVVVPRARLFLGKDAAMMKVTKPPHASESPHHTKGTETVCWITVWILLGLVCLTIVILLAKIAG